MMEGRYTAQEVCERGQTLYDQEIKAHVEQGNMDKFLVLDIETGEYEIDTDEAVAFTRAIAKKPDATHYLIRVGSANAHRLGSKIGTEF